MEDFLKDLPNQISTKEPLFGLDLHPQRNLAVFSSASGKIHVHQYEPNAANTHLFDLTHHDKSCRSVQFSPGDGTSIFSCSSDKSIMGVDLETKKIIFEQKKAHKFPISSMLLHERLVFTGDEDGIIKLWDPRTPDKVKEIAENDDYISSFVVNSDYNTLLATSGDQTLTVIDFRSNKAIDRSAEQDDELLSSTLIKGGRKVVCGGQSGLLSIFSWDQWSDRSSVCAGHPDSVDCILPIDENTVITGCGDGIIRIVSILPNKILGVISANSEELAPTSMAISRDKTYLAACIDTNVHFWNVSMLFNDDEENEAGIEEDQVVDGVEDAGDDYNDEEQEEDGEIDLESELTPSSESDDESSSSEDVPATGKAKGRRINEEKAAFFEDL